MAMHSRTTPARDMSQVRDNLFRLGYCIFENALDARGAMWMLSDFSFENEATRIVPGSHPTGEQPEPARSYEDVAVAVRGPPGTAFL